MVVEKMVSLRFKLGVNLVTMIDLLKMVKAEFGKAAYEKSGQTVVKVSTSLKVKTRFTWEPKSVSVQSDSLSILTNHGFKVLRCNAGKIKS